MPLPARNASIAPYPILPKNADAWMVKELQPGAIERNEGTVRCCTTLSIGKSESCPLEEFGTLFGTS